MDESYDLLSSMSPKVNRQAKTVDTKTFRKPPTMLALKKYFRRSSMINQKNDPMMNDTVIVVESGSSSNSGSSQSNIDRNINRTKNDTPIVISDSESSSSKGVLEKTPEKQIPIPNRTSDKNKISKRLSQEKFDNIKSWLDNVKNESNISAYTEVSSVLPEDNPRFKAPETNIAASSTFISPLVKRFDELFQTKNYIRADKFDLSSESETSTKINYFRDSFLSFKGDKNNSKPDVVVNDSFNTNEELDISKNSKKSFQDVAELQLNEKLSSRIKKKSQMNGSDDYVPDKSSKSVEEDCQNLLDNLYGNSWRANQEQILPSSEPRKKPVAKTKQPDHSKTERPKKVAAVYKNEHLESDSNNILRNLQIARFKEKLESPWVRNLKNVCDSDTDSSNSSKKLSPIKLDFVYDDKKSKRDKNLFICDSDSDTNEFLPSSDSDKKIKPAKKQKDRSNFVKPKPVSSSNKVECYSFLASLSSSVPISKCDMSARIFRNSFKKYRDQLTQKLFKMYNENIFENAIPFDTPLEWNDRMRGTAGYCYCRKVTHSNGNIERKVRIVLSTKVLDSADRVRDTLVHELCHAATWIVNQVSDGHGQFWKSWAHRAMKTFPELPPIKRCHQYVINTKYTYKCTGCGYSVGRHTKSLDTERKRCGYCYGNFEILLNKTTKKGETKSVPVTPKKEATGFALYVKENYATYKTPQLKHGDVMKILGQKFSAMKVSK